MLFELDINAKFIGLKCKISFSVEMHAKLLDIIRPGNVICEMLVDLEMQTPKCRFVCFKLNNVV